MEKLEKKSIKHIRKLLGEVDTYRVYSKVSDKLTEL